MTPAQLRMARAALELSIDRLAQEAVVSREAVAALESGAGAPEVASKLRATFEVSGIEFLGEDGVRVHETTIGAPKSLGVEALNSANDE